jgi:hypothetical protein
MLPPLLPGSYWCSLGYCLGPIGPATGTTWYPIGALPALLPGILCICSAALLSGIQLVLPVLVITAMPVDFRIKERNGRLHLLPAFKNLLITEVKTLFLFFGIICILNHILPV